MNRSVNLGFTCALVSEPICRLARLLQLVRTPLHTAANMGTVEVVKALLELGADPTALNNDGLTPADIAEDKGRSDVVQVLRSGAARTAGHGLTSD